MHTSLVLTIIGPDRHGLVEALSDTIAAHDGNWLESRMANLAGQFAGLLLITVPAAQAAPLREALQAMESQGLRIVVESGDSPAAEATRILHLELVGHDRPGIVRELARALRARRINVEELDSECYSAPMSGEQLFRARLELSVPTDADLNELHQTLEKLAEQLSLELTYDAPRQAEA
ncbi:MAG: ACT domain-containing protein [Phycisphaeraceae bacterium]